MHRGPRERAALRDRLRDARGGRVVFLSHCLLNENTRYAGGACGRGCVREIVEQCLEEGIGMVQMPCPEQAAWGGVAKPAMLRWIGAASGGGVARRLEEVVPRVAEAYTRRVYRRLARRVAREVEDYLRSGTEVVGIVAIDGSPSCGLHTTLDLAGSMRAMAALDPAQASPGAMNGIVRRSAIPGSGIFVDELRRALRARGIRVPFLAHDLFRELDGQPSLVQLRRSRAR